MTTDERYTRNRNYIGERKDDPVLGSYLVRDQEGNTNPIVSLAGKYCSHPWDWFEVLSDGRVFMCCATWLPVSIGNLTKESIEDIWNGPKAQRIRQSINDGSFRFCQARLCPQIQSDLLPRAEQISEEKKQLKTDMPSNINFSLDESCNISCPSCRIKRIQHNEGPQYESRKRLNDKLWDWVLNNHNGKKITCHITGSGDPWGSKIFREKLLELDLRDTPNIRLQFKTNGVMLTEKIWDQMWRLHNNIDRIGISIDAAHEDTYNITRREGDYKQLRKNLDFLHDHVLAERHKPVSITIDYVTQKANYKEMPDIIEIVKSRYPKFGYVMFTILSDWGTWPQHVYEDNSIWKEHHPEHQEFLKVLASIPNDWDDYVYWANIKGMLAKARATYPKGS